MLAITANVLNVVARFQNLVTASCDSSKRLSSDCDSGAVDGLLGLYFNVGNKGVCCSDSQSQFLQLFLTFQIFSSLLMSDEFVILISFILSAYRFSLLRLTAFSFVR